MYLACPCVTHLNICSDRWLLFSRFFFCSSSMRRFGDTQFSILAISAWKTWHLFGDHWSDLLCSRQLGRAAANRRHYQLWRAFRQSALFLPLFLSQSEWQVFCTSNWTGAGEQHWRCHLILYTDVQSLISSFLRLWYGTLFLINLCACEQRGKCVIKMLHMLMQCST